MTPQYLRMNRLGNRSELETEKAGYSKTAFHLVRQHSHWSNRSLEDMSATVKKMRSDARFFCLKMDAVRSRFALAFDVIQSISGWSCSFCLDRTLTAVFYPPSQLSEHANRLEN
jgi:hypothetical protein